MLRLFKHYVAFPEICLALFEAITFFFIMKVMISLSDGGGNGGEAHALIGLLTVMTFLLMFAVGFYSREMFSQSHTMLVRAAITFPLMVGLSALIVYGYDMLSGERAVSVELALVALAVFAPLTVVMRGVFLGIMNLDAFRHRVLVIGSGRLAAKIEALGRRPKRRFQALGFVEFGEGDLMVQSRLSRDEVFDKRGLMEFARENAVDEIVIASDERRGLPVTQLLACKLLGLPVIDFATFYEREAGEIDLDELKPSWLIFSDGFNLNRFHMIFKRVFDVAFSSLFLLLTLPVTALAAVAIKLDSRGPLFYRQERVGRNGATFDVLKFRSMRVDAEKDGPQWADAKDNRVTAVGQFIRKTRIDEIPQVVNVLKGDMSFIGPRPERPVFVEELRRHIPYYDERHRMKPGITGWAQVNYPYGASIDDAKGKLAYDLYYIKNNSFFLDLIILLRTVRVILWAEGAR
jgi:sugar transferase (PEP-CTERM system associated)